MKGLPATLTQTHVNTLYPGVNLSGKRFKAACLVCHYNLRKELKQSKKMISLEFKFNFTAMIHNFVNPCLRAFQWKCNTMLMRQKCFQAALKDPRKFDFPTVPSSKKVTPPLSQNDQESLRKSLLSGVIREHILDDPWT